MSPIAIVLLILGYFGVLISISYFTSKEESNDAFFNANKSSPWYLVAFGMIGASLSGVTFISVPGWVLGSQFSYMEVVFGYLVGYFVIATVLMPLYYKLNLTSIYAYLKTRFGYATHKTGASFFLLSRVIGSSFRLYLVAMVLQLSVFDKLPFHIPFFVTVSLTVALIWLYTYKGGIKTIIWTDTLQTFFMLTALVLTFAIVADKLGGLSVLVDRIMNSEYSQVFFFDGIESPKYFWKQFVSGAFIAIVMTGLDQDMMQKNLTCKSLGDAQKNMFWFSLSLVPVNFVFLLLGAGLYLYAADAGIVLPAKADELYPFLAINGYLSTVVALLFVLGLIAAAYSSADSALAALTTSFCVDILEIENRPEAEQVPLRKKTHLGFSLALIVLISIAGLINNDSIVSKVFTVAGYTYGPLLGIYSFGLFTSFKVKDKFVPYISILSPIICFVLSSNSEQWFSGYKMGFEVLILNGLLTFIGLFLIRTSPENQLQPA